MTSRLDTLVDFLEKTVPADRFTMGAWAGRKIIAPDQTAFCGCAIGWSAYRKLFPGLTLSSDDGGIPLYNGQCCYVAIQALFALPDIGDAKFLFSHAAYKYSFPRPAEVADRIRRFLREPIP